MSQASRFLAIARRAEEIDCQNLDGLNPQHPLGDAFWEQGGTAFRSEIQLEQCPLAAGLEQDDWLRGWMAAELVEFGSVEDDR
jgi:hypothetical protein